MRVVMLLHKSVEHDARVRREARALAESSHDVVVVHLPRPGQPAARAAGEGYEVRALRQGRVARSLPRAARRAIAALRMAQVARRERPDAVHAHDAAMLPPAWLAVRGTNARLVYDSHELATGVAYRSRPWALLVAAVERLLVSRVDAVVTVSEGIASALQRRYRLASTPSVVRNVADLAPPRAGVADLRAELGLDDEPLVIHHGALAADRGCESLLRAMTHLPDAHLLFLGSDGPYAAQAERLAGSLGVGARVHFRPPVPLADLLSYSSQADVGVTLLEGVSENHRLALPNKAFEYVASGIPVVSSDLPELSRLVREHGIGWTVDPADPSDVAAGIRMALSARSDPDLRERLARAAESLSWSQERELLLELYSGLSGADSG